MGWKEGGWEGGGGVVTIPLACGIHAQSLRIHRGWPSPETPPIRKSSMSTPLPRYWFTAVRVAFSRGCRGELPASTTCFASFLSEQWLSGACSMTEDWSCWGHPVCSLAWHCRQSSKGLGPLPQRWNICGIALLCGREGNMAHCAVQVGPLLKTSSSL